MPLQADLRFGREAVGWREYFQELTPFPRPEFMKLQRQEPSWWSSRGGIGRELLRNQECSDADGFRSQVDIHDNHRELHSRMPSALLL
jgi:hypothetical protein